MEFNATFLVSIISFILFTLIMNKIFYKPLERVMSEREDFIKNTLDIAKFSSEKADAVLKDRDDKLNQTTQDAKKMIAQGVANQKKDIANLIEDAKSKSKIEIDNTKASLSKQAKQLDENLIPEIEKLAGVISSKILGFEAEAGD